jgi:hypothetical protein
MSKYIIQTRRSSSQSWEDEPNGGNLPTLPEAKRVVRSWLRLNPEYEGNIRIVQSGGNKRVVWSGEAIKGTSFTAKSAAMKTFKDVSVYNLLPAMEATNQSDSDENPAMLDYAGDAARSFCKEWIEDTFDLDEIDRNEIEDAVRDAISMAVDENVSHSMFLKTLDSVRYALQRSFEQAGVDSEIAVDERKGHFKISVNPGDLMRAWREEVDGMGYSEWGGDESIKDITSASMMAKILDHRADVYGQHRLKFFYDDNFDRFEPDTGNYAELSKVATDAWKRHLREKHKAGTKHRH